VGAARRLACLSSRPMSAANPASQAESVLTDAGVSMRVVRGGGVRMAGFILMNLMGVLGSVVLLRHLGVVDYGRYGTVISLMAAASGIAEAGLTVTGSRELALRSPGAEWRTLLGTILGIRLGLSAASVLIGLAIGIAAGYDGQMLGGVVLVGIGAVLIAVQATILLPLVVRLRNASLTVSDLVKQGILLVGIVVLTVVGSGIVGFFALQIAIGLGALALVPFLAEREDVAPPRWSLSEWRDLAVIALPIAAAAVLTVIYLRLLVVLTSVLSSEYETGLFVTSARVVEIIGGLPLLISGVILPVVSVASRDARDRLTYVLARTTETSLLLGSLIAIVLILGARPVTVALGGSEFAAAAPVLRIQAPAVVTIFLVQAWATFLIADHHQADLVRCVLVGLVALLVAGLVFIPLWDARGAAAAAVAADLAYATALFIAVRRMPGRPVPVHLGFCGRLVVAAGAAIGVGLAAWSLPDAVAAALAGLVFAAGAVVLRMVPVDVYNAIRIRRGGNDARPE
jgi:O-antigen/teichoic acid export membrane protein